MSGHDRDWRSWAAFMFTDNSPDTQALPDDELRLLICRTVDVERDIYWHALNHIASWAEGEAVGGAFDEPVSAQMAREALADGDQARCKRDLLAKADKLGMKSIFERVLKMPVHPLEVPINPTCRMCGEPRSTHTEKAKKADGSRDDLCCGMYSAFDELISRVAIWAYTSSTETLTDRIAETSGAVAMATLKEVERRCLELSDAVDKDTAYVLEQLREELTR